MSTSDWPETTVQTTTVRIPSSRLRLNSNGSILGLAAVVRCDGRRRVDVVNRSLTVCRIGSAEGGERSVSIG
jgi:hypothetical protein